MTGGGSQKIVSASGDGKGGQGRGRSGKRSAVVYPLTAAELATLREFQGNCADAAEFGCNPFQTTPDPADPGEPGQVVTIEDLARFLPADAELHSEPDGWAVVGVPANFWVDVEPVTVDGELLAEQAQVRFTPVAYQWEYGDGAEQTTRVPGRRWEELGQDELTTTPTSHRYRERGRVDADVVVVYSAAYRVAGGGWVAVDGAVTDTTPPLDVLVVTERTVLTNGDV